MASREVHSCRIVLENAVIDGINIYIRDVLLPLGIIEENRLHDAGASLDEAKYRIAREVADSWEHCQIDDET